MSDPDALSLDIRRVPASRHHRPPRRPPGRPGLRRRRQLSARHRARGAGVVVGVRSHRRQSVVKVAYVRNRRVGAWRAHGAYLARDGAQRPGQRGLGFTASRDDLDLAATLGAWHAAGDARLWKAIISPEQGAELDLRLHAGALVRQMEHDLGTRLEWVAIDHHNTDNPHVHLLIRGRDDHGRPLTIDPGYVQGGIRERSEELATRVLGLRTDHEILASRARVVERAQFTELDCRLLARADAQGHVSYAGPFLRDRRRLAERSQELRRLEMLVSLGLARRIGAGRWALSRELEPTLRQCQLAGDIMKSRARHQAHLSDPRLPLVVTRIEAGTLLAGRVIGTGLADELRDRRYLLLEGTDRRLHYILQTRTWSERAGRRASAWATTSRSPATRSRGKGERAWADLPRPSARLREGPGRAPLRRSRHGPRSLGVPDGRPRARPRARGPSDQRGRPGCPRPSGPRLAPRRRAPEATGARPRAMRTLSLGTLLQAGHDPAASARAITPTAELPWRT